ncbi:MAG: hypothetical protein WDW36_007829 [Sanguina aurantia]
MSLHADSQIRCDLYANEFLVPGHGGHGGSSKDLAGLLGLPTLGAFPTETAFKQLVLKSTVNPASSKEVQFADLTSLEQKLGKYNVTLAQFSTAQNSLFTALKAERAAQAHENPTIECLDAS